MELSDELFPIECARKFTPERVLATGAFGTVFLATQVGLGRLVVVKLLKVEILKDPDIFKAQENRERFESEARITSALSHPNIVVILDYDASGTVPWIAYEYLPDGSLSQRLSRGIIPWPEALEATDQILAALEEAHSHQVLHRDIKPANVMVAGPGFYKVTDFGIAKWTTEATRLTQTGTLIGSPGYLAPERIMGEPATPQTDLYATGVSLFQMLTGQLPIKGETPYMLLTEQVNRPPPAPSRLVPDLPPGVDTLVLKALAKNPHERFLTAHDMREAIVCVQTENRVSATVRRAGAATEVLTQVEQTARRSPAVTRGQPAVSSWQGWLVRALMAAACLAAVAAVVWLCRPSGPRPPVESPGPTAAATRRPRPLSQTEVSRLERQVVMVLDALRGREGARFELLQQLAFSGPLTDYRRVQRLTEWLKKRDLSDFAVMKDVCEKVEEACPDPRGAPDGLLALRVKARAWCFVVWTKCDDDRRVLGACRDALALTERSPDTVDVRGLLHWENAPCDAEGVVLVERFTGLIPPVVERIATQPGDPTIRPSSVLTLVLEVSKELGKRRFSQAQQKHLVAAVDRMEKGLSECRGQIDSIVARSVLAFWRWGETTQSQRRMKGRVLFPVELQVSLEASFASDARALRELSERTIALSDQ